METPIFDFVQNYIEEKKVRFHMPGHKGEGVLGAEAFDITEIKGADSLYDAEGIIEKSEKNAKKHFGTKATFYSAEGSSLCIRAMLYLVTLYAKEKGRKPLIFAGRNAHKAFLSSVSLLDLEVEWLYSQENYLSLKISAEELKEKICCATEKPMAVYITCPDYLGNLCDISGIAEVCKEFGVLLLVDNAHGAYLKFLPKSYHPMDFGADLCCDSAHKTLPVLTGGAYLHVGENAPSDFVNQAKNAMAVFGSTSPSYLILQSLDLANRYLADGYREKLNSFVVKAKELKMHLKEKGYRILGQEPLKITIETKEYGYYGTDFAEILRKNNIECEFSDPDFVVLMLTPEQEKELEFLEKVLASIEKKEKILEKPPLLTKKERVLSVRKACLSPFEKTSVKMAEGKVLAVASVGCPPAVPVLVCGERIDKNAVEAFSYYGIENCYTVKESD